MFAVAGILEVITVFLDESCNLMTGKETKVLEYH